MMFWKKKEPIIKFASINGNFAVSTPVVSAAEFKTKWFKEQTPSKSIRLCPGLSDYYKSGYIVTAHCDIHIKANKAGVVANLFPRGAPDQIVSIKDFELKPFDPEIVKGVATPDTSVKFYAGKIPLPWAIFTQKGYSCHFLPALLHNDLSDKMYVYPGIVDTDNFHVINFVFTPLKEFEHTIYAGEPLLQIIPFKRENFTAICDKATEKEKDKYFFNIPTSMKQYYRKFLHKNKKYTMECPYKHRIGNDE